MLVSWMYKSIPGLSEGVEVFPGRGPYRDSGFFMFKMESSWLCPSCQRFFALATPSGQSQHCT